MSKLVDNLRQAERARRALSDGASEPEDATILSDVVAGAQGTLFRASEDAQAAAISALQESAAKDVQAGTRARARRDAETGKISSARERIEAEKRAVAVARMRVAMEEQAAKLADERRVLDEEAAQKARERAVIESQAMQAAQARIAAAH